MGGLGCGVHCLFDVEEDLFMMKLERNVSMLLLRVLEILGGKRF